MKTDANVQKAIHALDAEFERLLNAGQTDRLVATFYTEDAQLLAPGAPAAVGAAAIRELANGFASAYKEVRITSGPVVTTGDLAVSHGTFRARIVSPDGTSTPDQGKFVEAFRRGPDGSWKCFVDAFNSDVAGH